MASIYPDYLIESNAPGAAPCPACPCTRIRSTRQFCYRCPACTLPPPSHSAPPVISFPSASLGRPPPSFHSTLARDSPRSAYYSVLASLLTCVCPSLHPFRCGAPPVAPLSPPCRPIFHPTQLLATSHPPSPAVAPAVTPTRSFCALEWEPFFGRPRPPHARGRGLTGTHDPTSNAPALPQFFPQPRRWLVAPSPPVDPASWCTPCKANWRQARS